MNCNEKTFRRGNRNAHGRTARAGCGLSVWLAVSALILLMPRVAMGALDLGTLDLSMGGPQTLIGNDPTPQDRFFYVNNTSGAAITVGSLDFIITLGTGTGTTPYISSIDLLNGTIFQDNNGGHSYGGFGTQSAFSEVLKGSSAPSIPTGSSLLGTVSFVTAGTTSGTFSLSVNSSAYYTDDPNPQTIGLNFTGDPLTVVPEASTVVAAIFLVLFVAFHAIRQKLTRAGTNQPKTR